VTPDADPVPAGRSALEPSNRCFDLARLRKSAELFFGENELAVYLDFEDASGTLD